jgi:hypothetical protein
MPSKKTEAIITERGGKALTPYEIFKELQDSIKVGKGRFNAFAKFNYRSVEDIYEAWKALDVPLVLRLSDAVCSVEGRVFIEATAEVKDLTGKVVEFSKAQAELDAGKAGMSREQATGSASSYARKYALNGLFLLDDASDPDEVTGSKPGKTGVSKAVDNAAQKAKIKELQDLIRGDKAKTAEATKLLAGRSVIKLTIKDLDEIITAVKPK